MFIGDTNLVKIFFEFKEDKWHGNSSESLWAIKLNETTFKLKNSPFYFKNISNKDIIEAFKNEYGNLIFNKVIKYSNHSTYRIFLLNENIKLFEKYWNPLEKINCTYEKANSKLYSIDVPKETDIYLAYELLEKGMNAKVWDFEEGHCGHEL